MTYVELNERILADGREHIYRLALPVGHALFAFNAVPERGSSFDAQGSELRAQFERFLNRYVIDVTDCREMVLFIGCLKDIDSATALGKEMLGTRRQTTVLAKLYNPRWQVAMSAYFLRKA